MVTVQPSSLLPRPLLPLLLPLVVLRPARPPRVRWAKTSLRPTALGRALTSPLLLASRPAGTLRVRQAKTPLRPTALRPPLLPLLLLTLP